jgi:hypothetical protein
MPVCRAGQLLQNPGAAMADVLPFKKRSLKEKAKGRTLCARGFHKWVVDKQQRFDVKQGGLVTVHRCQRCGATKNAAI